MTCSFHREVSLSLSRIIPNKKTTRSSKVLHTSPQDREPSKYALANDPYETDHSGLVKFQKRPYGKQKDILKLPGCGCI